MHPLILSFEGYQSISQFFNIFFGSPCAVQLLVTAQSVTSTSSQSCDLQTNSLTRLPYDVIQTTRVHAPIHAGNIVFACNDAYRILELGLELLGTVRYSGLSFTVTYREFVVGVLNSAIAYGFVMRLSFVFG